MEYSLKKWFLKYICLEFMILFYVEMLIGISWNGEIFLYRGKFVECVGIKIVFNDFMIWLQKFYDVMIVVYNGWCFDFKVLFIVVYNCRLLDIFNFLFMGFCDLFDIF